jgi:ADP-ribosylglycohydrolase
MSLLLLCEKPLNFSIKILAICKLCKYLGKGWVAEEALAIAVYCALKYQDNFKDAIIASINHSDDSDSTGSVIGNILYAYLGYDKTPDKFLTNVELRGFIEEVATGLYEDCKMAEYSSCRDPVWMSKYIGNDYGKDREWQ